MAKASKPRRRRRRRDQYTERQFRPYVLAIGRIALAWNDLHEALGSIFCKVMNAKAYSSRSYVVLAAWQADKLEDDRNNAVHAPLLWVGADNPFAGLYALAEEIIPQTTKGNVRAGRLELADKATTILAEFKRSHKATVILRDFAYDVARSAHDGALPWPDRPFLPARPQKTKSPPGQSRSPKK